ncbi:MAG: hypothetical protein WC619_02025 [Patescibacteria group bacterium]
MKTKIIKKIPLICFCLVMAVAIDWSLAKITFFVLDPVKQYGITEVHARTQIYPAITDPIKKYVLTEVYDAGLNPDYVERLIQCESSWNNEIQVVEPDGTISSGIWQINSVNKDTIKPSERLDYKKATAWAIAKIKADGYRAWSCSYLIK